jgi:hypothetical protein
MSKESVPIVPSRTAIILTPHICETVCELFDSDTRLRYLAANSGWPQER